MSIRALCSFCVGAVAAHPSVEHARRGTAASNPVVTLSIQPTAPADAYGPISPSWLGFGIEGGSFPSYAGTPSKPNVLSHNLVETLSNRTGAPVTIRVGGTSVDHSVLVLDQSVPAYELGTKPKAISIGPSFFETFKLFPQSKYTLNVPFAYANLSYALQYTNRSLAYIGNRLNALEIGNEPSGYIKSSRPANWTIADYVQQWKQFADALDTQLQLPAGPIYEGLSLASSVYENNPTWTVENAFKDGYFDQTRIKTISQHYYEASNDKNIAGTLLNHSFTASQTNRFRRPIGFMQQKTPNIPFVLGEVGSTNGATIREAGGVPFAGGLGAAVWTVDWMLYAMSIGVTAVSMQLGNNFTFAAWLPEYSPALQHGPAVFAPYMSHVAIADFIGMNSSDLHVSSLQTGSNEISAYVGYKGGKPAQAVVANLQVFNGQGTRPTTSVQIPVSGQATHVQLRRLTGVSTQAITNVTWAGETWTVAGNGLPSRLGNATESVPVTRGKAVVTVGACEVVMVNLV